MNDSQTILSPMRLPFFITTLMLILSGNILRADKPATSADTVLINGKIVTLDNTNQIHSAIAIKDGLILSVGNTAEINLLIGKSTKVVDLQGKMVLPGFIETHCHSIYVANNELSGPYVELKSISEIQDWLKKQTKKVPKNEVIRVPRTDITRLKERRHPTPSELDAACSTHPVVFTAARKSVLNTFGFKMLGITNEEKSKPSFFIKKDKDGNPLLISGGDGDRAISKIFPKKIFSKEETLRMLQRVHQVYNRVGITSINERALDEEGVRIYQKLRADRKLTVRTSCTIRQQFRSGEEVVEFTKKLGMKTGDGDDWVRIGPLKITVDGGIHWGTTFLRQSYGKKRIDFYALNGIQSPGWMGSIKYSQKLMTDIFIAAHKLDWQMCTHVTGDAGVDHILNALEETNRVIPVTDRRFVMTHAYFPISDAIKKASRLGVCVDTQPYLYYKDSDAIATVYGEAWANRFIGVNSWIQGGIKTAINSDHMIGLDPNHSLQSFNPFLQIWLVVSRINEQGKTYGENQKVSRENGLRCCTSMAAHIDFNEQKKGKLLKGFLADMIIIDRNFFTCEKEQIKDIKVLTTILDGKIIYRRKRD